MSNNPLLARFASQPALVAASMRDQFDACLTMAAAHPDLPAMLHGPQASNDDNFWPAADDWKAPYRPYVIVDGILQIPVKGVLLHDFPYALGGWATGYAYIWRAFERGMSDGSVRGIALICDTPGGMVAGCWDAVDKMFAMRGIKPVQAFAHESAYSAGYAIASVADKIGVSQTGGVGSIGVVTSHVDLSGAMAKDGVKITFIHAGKHKVDGNYTEPLPDDVKARIQARIDSLYDIFVASVARNRGLDEQAVRDTEALCFTAAEAVSNGLADSIGSLDDSLAVFAADLSTDEGETMSTPDKSATEQAAVIETARADGFAAGRIEGHTAGVTEGMTAAKTRITAIIGSDVAKDRPAAALAAALDTDMSADQASAFLAKLPKEATEASSTSGTKDSGSTFSDAMNNGDNPNVGGDGSGAENLDTDATAIASDLALVQSFGLRGFAPAPAAK